MFIFAGGFCSGRQMNREDFVRLLLLEDFVCFMAGKILCREANVRHPSKAANIRKSYNQEPHILRR